MANNDPDIPLGGVADNNNYGIPPLPPPSAPAATNPATSTTTIPAMTGTTVPDDTTIEIIQQLRTQQGYSTGLAEALIVNNKRAFEKSFWVIDNSGSMQTRDGQRLVVTGNKGHRQYSKFVECTRWVELQQTVDYHVQLSALLQSSTTFRFLNDPGRVVGPQEFSICSGASDGNNNNIDHELAVAQQTIQNAQPGGVTPLTGHVYAIRQYIVQYLESKLRQNGTKVAIVLATDGLPTDTRGYSNEETQREFVHALRQLEGLLIWIVIRLCTDQQDVVDYFNDLDNQLELSIEVLDDFCAEAHEVHAKNPWLTYGLPLHRMREMGFHHSIFDILDERKLSKDELIVFFKILLGHGPMSEVPDPEADWHGFVERVKTILDNEEKQWDPVHKKMMPWIDIKQLNRDYGPKSLLASVFGF